MSQTPVSKTRTRLVFVATVLAGFLLFVVPNLFFGITGFNGGLTGINLAIVAFFQFGTVCALLYGSLAYLGRDFRYIGLTAENSGRDAAMGLAVGLSWTALQIGWIVPATGGAERADVAQMIATMEGGAVLGLVSYAALGVIGGGITEEIYNRGYFITVLKDTFENPRAGLWIAAVLSVLFFAVGHLPTNAVAWFDILVPTVAYTLLFVYTGRLTASMTAHGVYNLLSILSIYFVYAA